MTKTFQQRPTVLAAELVAVTLLLAACGGGADESNTSAAETTSATSEASEASLAADSMSAQHAAAVTEAEAQAAAGTGPKADDAVEAAAESPREAAAAVGYARPKVAALEYGWNVTAAQQQSLARFGLSVIDKGRTRGANAYNAFANGVKSYNPNAKLAQYVINGELRCNADHFNYNNLVYFANSADYWLRYANGVRAQWNTKYSACDINLTQWAKRAANGQTWPAYKWQQDRNAFFGATPRMDYVYIDTLFLQPRTTSDYKRIRVNQSGATADIAASYRRGQVAYINELRRTNPNLKVMANADNDLSYPEYRGVLDGSMLEAEMGKSWSVEATRGWAASWQRYRNSVINTRGPKDVIYEAIGTQWEYRKMRYGLGTALMDNGYYMYRGTSASEQPWWYDEYAAPIGTPTQAPPTRATQNGIWTRTFQNGIVLLNPQNFTATITIPAQYKRLSGGQQPGVNNGAWQNVITLGAKDALIMVRR